MFFLLSHNIIALEHGFYIHKSQIVNHNKAVTKRNCPRSHNIPKKTTCVLISIVTKKNLHLMKFSHQISQLCSTLCTVHLLEHTPK